MRKIISLICFLLPVLAFAGQTESTPQLRSDAPDQYVVVKGDTLWGISGMFFKDPWRWPYIWGMNKDAIKDPHWIYPGATIVLDRANGTLSMGGKAGSSRGDVIRLSPQVRSESSTQNAIPSIPSEAIEPFLSQPLVVSDALLAGAPTLVGLPEERVIVGTGDVVYAKGLTEGMGKRWQVYRPGKTFVDPDTNEVLGYEAIYLGGVEIRKFGDISTAVVTDAKREINLGDRLVAPAAVTARNYLPRAPESQINARVISIYGGVTQGGQNTVITLNKGERDGLQSGHVLALSSKGRIVKSEGKDVAMPDERYGLLFVFRVFDKVSYALVMQTRLPVQLLDFAQTP
ncbi:MAG: LysM peptidoglycan-binding domain-containing protein [Gallionella sp.]|jgi:nucleoid-associated protein YgaU